MASSKKSEGNDMKDLRKILVVVLVVLLIGVSVAGCTSNSGKKKKSNNLPVAAFLINGSNETSVIGSVNAPVTFDASPSSDKDKDALSFTWDIVGATGGPFEQKTFNLPFATLGTFQVTLTVKDTKQGQDSETKSVIIVNDAPIIESATPTGDILTAKVGEEVTFAIIASDANGDLILYRWFVNSGPISGANGSQLAFTFTDAHYGVGMMEVEVSDGQGGTVTWTWNITVQVNNRPPRIISRTPSDENVVATEEESIDFSVNALDPDGDAPGYSWKLDGTVVTEAITNNYTFQKGYDKAGSYTVQVTITDPKMATNNTMWALKVENVNRPPSFTKKEPTTPTLTLAEMSAQVFDVKAEDPDGDSVQYQWSVDGVDIPGEIGTRYVYIPDFNASGGRIVKCSAKDFEDTSFVTWTVTVSNVNQPPIIKTKTPGAAAIITENTTYTFTILAQDPDGDAMTYKWELNNNEIYTAKCATYQWTPSFQYTNGPNAPYNLTVYVFDTILASNKTTWTGQVVNLNRPPEAAVSVDWNFVGISRPITFNGTGSNDSDGDTMTYSWLFGDGKSSSGYDTITHSYDKPGTFIARLSVNDPNGGSAEAEIAVYVNMTEKFNNTGKDNISPMYVNDIDQDGTAEALYGEWTETLGVYHGYLVIWNGRTNVQEWKSSDIGRVTAITALNLDADQQLEVVVGTWNTTVTTAGLWTFTGEVYIIDGLNHGQSHKGTGYGKVLDIAGGNSDADNPREVAIADTTSTVASGTTLRYYGNLTILEGAGGALNFKTPAAVGGGTCVAMGDTDVDSRDEVVMGAIVWANVTPDERDGELVIIDWNPGSTTYGILCRNGTVEAVTALVLDNLDGTANSNNEIIITTFHNGTSGPSSDTNSGFLWVFNDTLVKKTKSITDYGNMVTLAAQDVNNDQAEEIVFGTQLKSVSGATSDTKEGYLYVINGTTYNQITKSTNIGYVTAMALGDLNDNHQNEIVVGTWTSIDTSTDVMHGKVNVFDGKSFELIWSSPDIGAVNERSLAVGNLDNSVDNAIDEWIAGVSHTLDTTGEVWAYTNQVKSNI